ncbi:hypothetical protein KC340_g1800 [Hortaea werneckii]|nr:hypothetical protein KC342_g611 [Hortaea werneckii]KAI7107902.1 hypothetical protein KC339_g1968 [Hortaea werneckii]KAI7220703.1 hypothetical protein KC365_g11926 [Hortaea werneckii]KAI7336145.1 hypothetical protein KC340_g1800 [Hortaea werneckii]KAI7406627.1 hypothetical protein KC328_g863 [Hortaea werneckii]
MAPRRSRRLASREPEDDVGEYTISPMRKARHAAAFDVDAAIDRRLAGERAFIYRLTVDQRKAVIDGLTDRNARLTSRIGDLEEEVAKANPAASGRKRSLQQAAARERIERQAKQRRQLRESATPSSTPSRRQSPESEQQQEEESRAQTTAAPVTTPGQDEKEQHTQALTTILENAASTPPANNQPVPMWRKFMQNATNCLSPFKRRPTQQQQTATPQIVASERKRQAPEESTEQAIKRVRTVEQPRRLQSIYSEASTAQETPTQKRITASVPQSAPAARRQPLRQPREAKQTIRRRRSPSVENTSKDTRAAKKQSFTSSREPSPAAQKQVTAAENITDTKSSPIPTKTQVPTSELEELTPASRKRSAPSDDIAATPGPASHNNSTPKVKTPHTFHGPSSKNSQVPTSLSTVTEESDISRIKNSLLSTSTLVPPMTTPSRMPHQRRTVAEARRSRLSHGGGLGTPRLGTPRLSSRQSQNDAWSRGASTAPRPSTAVRPVDNNADRRFEKMERMRRLQRELEELQKDEDIREMESHRRKRVKVDDLQWIPHNRPGEGSGTFRVPDWDSDDEMEVEIDVPLRTNVFEEVKEKEPEPEPEKVPSPVKQSSLLKQPSPIKPLSPVKQPSSLKPPQAIRPPSPVKQVSFSPVKQVQEFHQSTSTAPGDDTTDISEFNFPSVGSRAPDDMHDTHEITEFNFPSVGPLNPVDVLTPEEENSCREEFAAGFQKFLVEKGFTY